MFNVLTIDLANDKPSSPVFNTLITSFEKKNNPYTEKTYNKQ